ncbi:MAG: hypothetical protein ACI9U0_000335 [Flavobacteriales bacterium]|jgi:hypothetical protein|tara:strand:- start:20775 stop:21605 length:831 start_codon:yes stop_codon:yes gene_type:complete
MKWLITSLPVFICINVLVAQTNVATNYENSMLKIEQEIYMSENDTLKNELYLIKFNSSLKEKDFKRSYFELSRVRGRYFNDLAILQDFYWNASLISKLVNKVDYAETYYDAYLGLVQDSSVNTQLLGLLINAELDSSSYNEFKKTLTLDTALNCIDCLSLISYYRLKNKLGYIWASRLVPGLGTVLTGDIYNGLGSVISLGGASYGVYHLFLNKLYLSTGIWGYLFIPRFYFGNIRMTKYKLEKLEEKRRAKLAIDCELTIKELLIKYPIDFRLSE